MSVCNILTSELLHLSSSISTQVYTYKDKESQSANDESFHAKQFYMNYDLNLSVREVDIAVIKYQLFNLFQRLLLIKSQGFVLI